MLIILKYFWQMCLLKSGPDKIPAQPLLLAAVLGFYVAAEIIVAWLIGAQQSFIITLGMISIELTLQASVTYLLLLFLKLQRHFLATYTAILGIGVLNIAIQLPLLLIRQVTEIPTLLLFSDTAWLICICWWLAIIGHIYHRAANISIFQNTAIQTFIPTE